MFKKKQMSWYVSNKYGSKWVDTYASKTCSRPVWDVRSIHDKHHFDDIFWIQAALSDRLHRKSTTKKKNQTKA